MTTEFVEIHWTAASLEEARKIARFLVQERIVACANIVPWVESIYMWNNKLETTQESKVIFKTNVDQFDAIKHVILQNCTYEIPEITMFKIEKGNSEYLDWIKESTLAPQKTNQS